MPHKFNADRRDKIPKQKYRLANWAEYNEGLRRRGDLTIWVNEDALGLWFAPHRTTRDGQRRYSGLAIEICLTLGVVFKHHCVKRMALCGALPSCSELKSCLLYTSPSPRDKRQSRMPSSA